MPLSAPPWGAQPFRADSPLVMADHVRFLLDAPSLAGFAFPDSPIQDIPEETAPPTSWVQLAKTGKFKHPVHGRFRIGHDTYESIVRNFRAAVPTDRIAFDFDHDPDYGGKTEACGWIIDLEVRGDELWGRVEWAWAGAYAIRERTYRYVSPTIAFKFSSDDETERGPTLIGAALTNRPFLERMAVVSLSRTLSREAMEFASPESEDPSDSRPRAMNETLRKILASALGLKDDATEDDILAASQKVVDDADGTVTLAAQPAQPQADEPTVETVTAAAAKVGLTVVPTDELATLKHNAEAGKQANDTLRDERFDRLFTDAVKAGKVAPAEKDTMRVLYDAKGADDFKTYLDGRQPLVNTTALGSGEGDDTAPAGVDADRHKLHRKVEAHAAKHNVDYMTALRAVTQAVAA